MKTLKGFPSPAIVVLLLCAGSLYAKTIHVATYNVDNYLEQPIGTRPAKSAEAKAKIAEIILSVKPDVIAFQEMGGTNALLNLRSSLKAGGLDYPHWEHITGYDTNIHVAILSTFPISARRPHTNDHFLLNGRRFKVSRGFAEVDIQVSPDYSFTLITAHLKSRRPVPEADELELREQEAIKLRDVINARLTSNLNANLLVVGDLNDVKDSRSTKLIVGKGKSGLFDTRPAERNGDNLASGRVEPRHITWTHFYGKEDTYSRIDYILVSNAMKREWLPGETFIVTTPNWGMASDHRMLVAGFTTDEK